MVGVGDPLLPRLVCPVALQVLDGLAEIVGGDVDGRAVASATRFDVGEFAAAAVLVDGGGVHGCALGAGRGDGVAGGEPIGVELAAGELEVAAVVEPHPQGASV